MDYREALQRWAADYISVPDWQNIMITDDGYIAGGCSGGHYDGDYCYCDSAAFNIEFTYTGQSHKKRRSYSYNLNFNLGEFLTKILEISKDK